MKAMRLTAVLIAVCGLAGCAVRAGGMHYDSTDAKAVQPACATVPIDGTFQTQCCLEKDSVLHCTRE